jgi:hypothetical protein
MRLIWKIAVPIACLAAIAGASFAWHAHKTKADAAAKVAEEVRVDRLGAEQGNAEAQTKLGHLYYYGRGVPKSYSESVRWFKKAADQGYAKGQDDFGSMYYYGEGVPQDYTIALVWFRKAADQGDRWAQDMLGTMAYYGRGMPQDYPESLRWYHKAADQGDVYAQADLGDVYYGGKAVPQDYAEAARWFRKAADQGNSRAEYGLSYMYRYGKGVPPNFAEARRWSLKAASQGNETAIRAISCPFTTFVKVGFLIKVVGGLFFAIAVVRFRLSYFATAQNPGPLTLREKLTGAAGILILVSTGYEWYCYTHYKFRPLSYGLNGWAVGKWLFVAAVIALIVSMLRLGNEPDAREAMHDSADTEIPQRGRT